jgi:hypothetical protein
MSGGSPDGFELSGSLPLQSAALRDWRYTVVALVHVGAADLRW